MCTLMHGVHPEALLTRVSHCIDGERHLSTRPPSSFARGSGDGFIDPYEFERGLLPQTRRKIEEKLDGGWTFDKGLWEASCARHASD